MKRIAVSLGLIAMGAPVVLVAAPADTLSPMQASKAWTVSASLRGFYDDNYTLANSNRRSSAGFEVSPQVSLNLPLEQTLITASYIYSYRYYADRENVTGLDPADQSHQFSLDVTHAFSQRLTANVHDEFVIAQEPGLVDPTGSFPGRANNNNIRNTGSTTWDLDLTPKVGLTASYQNNYVDYDQQGGTATNASLSGLLDRDEHLASLGVRFRITPSTTATVGYQFGMGCYSGDEDISVRSTVPLIVTSSMRDYYSHYGFAGVTHTFNQSLSGSVKGGIRYTDYYNDPNGSTDTTPYAEANLSYGYAPGCSATLGFRHDLNPTDIIAPDSSGGITLQQESSTVYLNVTHRFTPKITGTATGNMQASTFEGGSADGKTDWIYGLGLDVSYAFNEHFSADLGYNYDDLNSDISGRAYSRNRIYIGFTATY